MIIGNPAFCLALYLTGVHFRGELHDVSHVGEQKSSVDQSEFEKQLVSDFKRNYMKSSDPQILRFTIPNLALVIKVCS